MKVRASVKTMCEKC
ncbi:MAG: 50S ribosomal protein L36, partial [Acidimicrobiaceae bacterium]|nr:50S ribosomal protein L36 [Acidimicrobiaceae bacterium]